MGLMKFSNDVPNNCDGLKKKNELNLKVPEKLSKLATYWSKKWNPTNVLDHVADVMTYIRNIEDEVQHGIELNPTATGIACTV